MNCSPCEVMPVTPAQPARLDAETIKKTLTPEDKAFLQLIAKAFVKSILS